MSTPACAGAPRMRRPRRRRRALRPGPARSHRGVARGSRRRSSTELFRPPALARAVRLLANPVEPCERRRLARNPGNPTIDISTSRRLCRRRSLRELGTGAHDQSARRARARGLGRTRLPATAHRSALPRSTDPPGVRRVRSARTTRPLPRRLAAHDGDPVAPALSDRGRRRSRGGGARRGRPPPSRRTRCVPGHRVDARSCLAAMAIRLLMGSGVRPCPRGCALCRPASVARGHESVPAAARQRTPASIEAKPRHPEWTAFFEPSRCMAFRPSGNSRADDLILPRPLAFPSALIGCTACWPCRSGSFRRRRTWKSTQQNGDWLLASARGRSRRNSRTSRMSASPVPTSHSRPSGLPVSRSPIGASRSRQTMHEDCASSFGSQ